MRIYSLMYAQYAQYRNINYQHTKFTIKSTQNAQYQLSASQINIKLYISLQSNKERMRFCCSHYIYLYSFSVNVVCPTLDSL